MQCEMRRQPATGNQCGRRGDHRRPQHILRLGDGPLLTDGIKQVAGGRAGKQKNIHMHAGKLLRMLRQLHQVRAQPHGRIGACRGQAQGHSVNFKGQQPADFGLYRRVGLRRANAQSPGAGVIAWRSWLSAGGRMVGIVH